MGAAGNTVATSRKTGYLLYVMKCYRFCGPYHLLLIRGAEEIKEMSGALSGHDPLEPGRWRSGGGVISFELNAVVVSRVSRDRRASYQSGCGAIRMNAFSTLLHRGHAYLRCPRRFPPTFRSEILGV